MKILTEKKRVLANKSQCRVLDKFVLSVAVKVNSPQPWYEQLPLSSSLSCIQGCFALNSTVYTTNYKAYHLLPVPHKPSVPVSLLPPLCVCVCGWVCAWVHVHTCLSIHACAQVCAIEECSVFPMSGVIFRIYLHTLLVHN